MPEEKIIGIFDSGYGGLSVLLEAVRRLRDVRYLYYADTDHVPYGSRSNDEILLFSDAAVRHLTAYGADAVIIACNTASAVSASYLREKFDLPIVAMEPAVRPALREGDARRVLVMATPVTLREEKLKNLIRREHGEDRIDLLPMPELVELAEREDFDGPAAETYIRKQLTGYNPAQYSAIVLGCTHFNYFRPLLRRILDADGFTDIHLIEGSAGTVRRAASLLNLPYAAEVPDAAGCDLTAGVQIRYFCSGREVTNPGEREHISHLLHQLAAGRKI